VKVESCPRWERRWGTGYPLDNVEDQKDFMGLKYEYVSTDKGINQQKSYMPKKS